MRPVGVHIRTGDQGDGQRTYAISVPREYAEQINGRSFMPELLPGGTLVFRPMVPVYEAVASDLQISPNSSKDSENKR